MRDRIFYVVVGILCGLAGYFNHRGDQTTAIYLLMLGVTLHP